MVRALRVDGGGHRQWRRVAVSLAWCLLAVTLVFVFVAALGRTIGFRGRGHVVASRGGRASTRTQPEPESVPPPLAKNCSVLPGVDCSDALGQWAGAEHCAILAETDGTCSAYCA